MSLKNSLRKIKRALLQKYGDNLAGILIFGSANTGKFKEGISDIDHMIFLKKQNKLNFKKEGGNLIKELKTEHFATQYFHSLKSIKNYIKKRKSFSTYITIVGKKGSITLYTTPEFNKTKKWLLEHPPKKQEIQKAIRKKDKSELKGYFKNIKGYELTKALMSHLRRKLQIINYFKTGKLIFGYKTCLKKIDLPEKEKEKLKRLYLLYEKRKKLSKKELKDYYYLADRLTKKIIKTD